MRDSIENQLASIQSALVPNGIMCLESTPQGGATYFSEIYKEAEEGKNLWTPVFFSWVDDVGGMHKDEQAQFAQRYIDKHGQLPDYHDLDDEEVNIYNRGATFEMIAWRRLKISQMKSKKKFNENFPVDAAQAFLTTTNDNMFNTDMINRRMSEIKDKKPIPMPEDLPKSLQRFYGHGLSLWSLPEKDTAYYLGVDCSEGEFKHSDYSVIEIIDIRGNHVGELRTKTKPFIFAELCKDLGEYFNGGMLVIERASTGHAVLSKVKDDYGYYNLYRSRGENRKTIDGYSTNSQTKVIMTDDFIEWFEKGMVHINSTFLLNEMLAFVFKNGKREASIGHDDCVMAMSMAIQAAKDGRYYA
jgi:hypothetical protein